MLHGNRVMRIKGNVGNKKPVSLFKPALSWELQATLKCKIGLGNKGRTRNKKNKGSQKHGRLELNVKYVCELLPTQTQIIRPVRNHKGVRWKELQGKSAAANGGAQGKLRKKRERVEWSQTQTGGGPQEKQSWH